MQPIFSTRKTAEVIGLTAKDEWRIRRLFEDGTLTEPPRFGGKRVISGELIPQIIDAMRARGWLPAQSATSAAKTDKSQSESPGRAAV
jgi:hypothetical protein